MKFRRAMTITERRALRREIVEREVGRAYQRASTIHLTDKCRRAMVLTGENPEAAQALHESCRGEEYPRGAGCLCLCHDVVTGSIITGSWQGK